MTKNEMYEQKRKLEKVVNATRRACKTMQHYKLQTTEETEAYLLQKINSSQGNELIECAKELAAFKAACMRYTENQKQQETETT